MAAGRENFPEALQLVKLLRCIVDDKAACYVDYDGLARGHIYVHYDPDPSRLPSSLPSPMDQAELLAALNALRPSATYRCAEVLSPPAMFDINNGPNS